MLLLRRSVQPIQLLIRPLRPSPPPVPTAAALSVRTAVGIDAGGVLGLLLEDAAGAAGGLAGGGGGIGIGGALLGELLGALGGGGGAAATLAGGKHDVVVDEAEARHDLHNRQHRQLCSHKKIKR